MHARSDGTKSSSFLVHGIACRLGQIGSVMLYVGSVVMETPSETPWAFHIACASGFFILTFVANALFLKAMWNRNIISKESIRFKTVMVIVQAALITANVTLTVSKQGVGGDEAKGNFPGGALLEWLLTFATWGYNFSFVRDLASIEREYIVDDQDLISRDFFGLLETPRRKTRSSM